MDQKFEATNTSRKYQGPGMSEYVAAMRAIWGPDPVQFDGKYCHIAQSLINPKPIQQGGIPIIIGANAPSTIKLVGRIADGLVITEHTFEALEASIKAFRTAVQEAGRDPSTIKIYARANGVITTNPLTEERRAFLSGSPDQIARDLDRICPLNIEHVQFFDYGRSFNIDLCRLDTYIENLARLQSVVRA